MNIITVGLSHKTAPVEVREKLSFPESKMAEALYRLCNYEGIEESMILSTCNRVEIYAVARDIEDGVLQIKRFLRESNNTIKEEEVVPHLYIYTADDAVRHVFRVAASLDSMVVGESQILGQLKDAFECALSHKCTKVILNRLLKKAISVAKRIRTETKIAESAVSVSSVAVELAIKIFGSLENKRVLLVGAGEMAELAARHLLANGVKNIVVTTRTYDRASQLASEFKGEAIRFEDFPKEMVKTDILICSTSAPMYIIKYEDIHRIIHERKNRPVFLIDISVPRNIEPRINEIDNVYLYDIDDLQTVVSANLKEREKEAAKAEEIIVSEVRTFTEWLRTLGVVPTIVALKEKVEEIRKAELEKTLSKLKDISDEERRSIEGLTNSIINKILHAPLVALKNRSNSSEGSLYVEVARRLFNLDRDLPHHEHDKGEGEEV